MKRKTTLIGILSISVLMVAGLTYGLRANFARIAPQEAQKICDEHNQRAFTEVGKLQGYSIKDSATQCRPRGSELGNDGYIAASTFLLVKREANNQQAIVTKADTEKLKLELPVFQNGWDVRNIFDETGQSKLICVSTGSYFKYDGKFYDHNGRLNTQVDKNNEANFYGAKTDLGYSEDCLEKPVQN